MVEPTWELLLVVSAVLAVVVLSAVLAVGEGAASGCSLALSWLVSLVSLLWLLSSVSLLSLPPDPFYYLRSQATRRRPQAIAGPLLPPQGMGDGGGDKNFKG